MTVTPDELVCLQCGGDDIRVDIHPEPYSGPSIGRIEALCVLCGRRVTAHIPPANAPVQSAEVTDGNGAYVIVTTDRTYYGAIESPWSEMHQLYFDDVFASREVVCGRVTRWDPDAQEPAVVFQKGDLEKMIALSKEKVESC